MRGSSAINARGKYRAQARSGAMSGERILVIDDEILLRLLSATVLGRSGYVVDTAEDGQSGWEALHARHYDLLITDNNMPKVTGLELIKRLRGEAAALPVILVSGEMPTEELNRSPWLHLAATLEKPFSGEELLATVIEVLRREPDRKQSKLRPARRGELAANALL